MSETKQNPQILYSHDQAAEIERLWEELTERYRSLFRGGKQMSDLDTVADEVTKLKDEIERLKKLVRVCFCTSTTVCPCCGAYLVVDFHKDDCELAAVLGLKTKSELAREIGWDEEGDDDL